MKKHFYELAKEIGVPSKKLLDEVKELGLSVKSHMSVISEEDYQVIKNLFLEQKKEEKEEEKKTKKEKVKKIPRPPVVVVLGHVDHGKTTLLDAIRQTNVVGEEKGEITQHIGASTVELPGGEKIVFLDTPGHEAFTSLRARGAQITDIAVLVVAADDGVQPQTKEAIDHAKAAGIPIVVAINKIDKNTANVQKAKNELASLGLVAEDMGGKTLFVNVSALKKTGIDALLEAILLEAEMLELTADLTGAAQGYIIENRMDKGRGPVATVLIRSGTLKVGDSFISGNTYGKVRTMVDDFGRIVHEASPSCVVEVSGFSSLPVSGDLFQVLKDERTAKRIAEEKKREKKTERMKDRAIFTLESLREKTGQEQAVELRCIIKTDVQGSQEALQQAVEKLSSEEVTIKLIHQGIGDVNKSDVVLAQASEAIIIGFNVGVDASARNLAKEEGIELRLYDIIYDVVDDIKKAIEGLTGPKLKEILLGRAEVKQTFSTSKGKVAGVRVIEGKVVKGTAIHILRDTEQIHTGKINSLRRFKENVNEVKEGYECGIGVLGFEDFQPGDIIEVYTLKESK